MLLRLSLTCTMLAALLFSTSLCAQDAPALEHACDANQACPEGYACVASQCRDPAVDELILLCVQMAEVAEAAGDDCARMQSAITGWQHEQQVSLSQLGDHFGRGDLHLLEDQSRWLSVAMERYFIAAAACPDVVLTQSLLIERTLKLR